MDQPLQTANNNLHRIRPTDAQTKWLKRGLSQPGGKLPLFDEWGQKVDEGLVRRCITMGWAEPWFANPLKPDWIVCKLTPAGSALFHQDEKP